MVFMQDFPPALNDVDLPAQWLWLRCFRQVYIEWKKDTYSATRADVDEVDALSQAPARR